MPFWSILTLDIRNHTKLANIDPENSIWGQSWTSKERMWTNLCAISIVGPHLYLVANSGLSQCLLAIIEFIPYLIFFPIMLFILFVREYLIYLCLYPSSTVHGVQDLKISDLSQTQMSLKYCYFFVTALTAVLNVRQNFKRVRRILVGVELFAPHSTFL